MGITGVKCNKDTYFKRWGFRLLIANQGACWRLADGTTGYRSLKFLSMGIGGKDWRWQVY
jgi:hypothetical protein